MSSPGLYFIELSNSEFLSLSPLGLEHVLRFFLVSSLSLFSFFLFFFFFKPIVVRKLQEFELPYVSVTSLQSQEYKIVLRKRSGLGLKGGCAGLDYQATF